MKIAIMQPYIFPYIGYFQLIREVDLFVFYNDVNYIKRGWINRNRILLNNKEFLFTIPCKDVSQNRKICETRLAFDAIAKKKFLDNVYYAYNKAPHFEIIYPLIEHVILREFNYIDELAIASIKECAYFLQMESNFKISEGQYNNEELKKADRLIDICRKENISNYINPIGGEEIYAKGYFKNEGIDLQFLRSLPFTYTQFNQEFVPWLSIIDILMFNTKEAVTNLLNLYNLE